MDRGRARLGGISYRAGRTIDDMSRNVQYSPVPSFGTCPGASALRESGAFSLSASMVGMGWEEGSRQASKYAKQNCSRRKKGERERCSATYSSDDGSIFIMSDGIFIMSEWWWWRQKEETELL